MPSARPGDNRTDSQRHRPRSRDPASLRMARSCQVGRHPRENPSSPRLQQERPTSAKRQFCTVPYLLPPPRQVDGTGSGGGTQSLPPIPQVAPSRRAREPPAGCRRRSRSSRDSRCTGWCRVRLGSASRFPFRLPWALMKLNVPCHMSECLGSGQNWDSQGAGIVSSQQRPKIMMSWRSGTTGRAYSHHPPPM